MKKKELIEAKTKELLSNPLGYTAETAKATAEAFYAAVPNDVEVAEEQPDVEAYTGSEKLPEPTEVSTPTEAPKNAPTPVKRARKASKEEDNG